jgi:putative hemolysin
MIIQDKMKNKSTYFFWTMMIFFSMSAQALNDPSMAYCQTLGYQSIAKETAGGAVNICKLTGGVECDSWDFLMGKCGKEYSYCVKSGYQQKTAVGAECGSEDLLAECLICILPNGSSAEVTSLMNLDIQEAKCGDGICVLGMETHESCPQDCPVVATTLEEVSTTQRYIPTTLEETTMPPQTTQPTITTTMEQPQETTSIPETTTTLADLCGNSVCDPSENFDSCPQDCSKPTGPVDYLPYIVIIVVLLLILFVVKKKLDEKKIAKEKAEFEKWKQEKGGAVQ